MRVAELEALVLDATDRVKARRPVEDSRVELKREWVEPHVKAARRLCAQLNASRGDDAIWIMGVDEKANGIVGVEEKDSATWWQQVRSCFDEAEPELLRERALQIGGVTVVALHWSSELAPYVVKAKDRNGELEIWWREGTAARLAKRRDLIRILAPLAKRPAVEIIDAGISKEGLGGAAGHFACRLIVAPLTSARVHLVRHRATIRFEGAEGWETQIALTPDTTGNQEAGVHRTAAGMAFDDSGTLVVSARAPLPPAEEQELTLTLPFAADTDPPLVVRMTLAKQGSEWRLKKSVTPT